MGLLVVVIILASAWGPLAARATISSCTVERVIDGDTFVCDGGTHVRMLQINALELDQCGGPWAGAALAQHLPAARDVRAARLRRRHRTTGTGATLAAPIVTGADGRDYNISIVMVYVGLAKWAYYGDNAKYLDWAKASQAWAKTAQWNMWAPGGPVQRRDELR